MAMIDTLTGVHIVSELEAEKHYAAVFAFQARNADEPGMNDIFGKIIDDEVMPHVGWKFSPGGSQLVLLREDQDASTGKRCVGLAWALPTVDPWGQRRINLTYAIDPDEAGQGLATTAACAAVLAASTCLDGVSDVSAQIRTDNLSSQHIARALGLRPDARLDFACETSLGLAEFVGFSCDLTDFLARAEKRPRNRLVESAPVVRERERIA